MDDSLSDFIRNWTPPTPRELFDHVAATIQPPDSAYSIGYSDGYAAALTEWS